jgi:SWI/SNF-related matrix-associated actin-dependent regulator of chromatin subfamily A member 5
MILGDEMGERKRYGIVCRHALLVTQILTPLSSLLYSGLGKTLQTISLLCYLKETEQYSGPSLVICPLSVLYSWCNEITKWAPSLKFLRLHSSSSDERESQKMSLQEKFATFDVVITTYEMAKSPSLQSFWRRQFFNYLILDEGHIIRNRETHIAEAVRKLHYENTMILTGTPLQVSKKK